MAGICMTLCIAALLSCGDIDDGVSGPDDNPFNLKDTFNIVYLLPVSDNVIRIDTVSGAGIVLSWNPVASFKKYSVYVYDSSDTARPDHVIMADTTTRCTIKRYKPNHAYYVRIFATGDILLVDSTRIAISSATGDSCTFIFARRSIHDSVFQGFAVVDTAFTNILGYKVFASTNTVFNVRIDNSVVSQKRLLFLKDFHPAFKVRFPVYRSPKIVTMTRSRDSVTVSWNRVSGEYLEGYRIYCRDYTGQLKDSVNLDSTDTMVIVSGTIRYTTNKANGVFKNVSADAAYKLSITTVSKIRPGPIDTSFSIDTANSVYNTFKLPYYYYSTYRQPPVLKDTAMVPLRGGLFVMGEAWGDEDPLLCPGAKPAHEVCVSSYYLNRHEVTVWEFARFLNVIDNTTDTSLFSINGAIITYRRVPIADTSKETWFISRINDSFVVDAGREMYPALCLYWHGAAAYCNWLSANAATLGLHDAALDTCFDAFWRCDFSKNGYRLPTEAEFEYAASTTASGIKQRFPWGYAWDASKAAVGGKAVEAVGSYAPYEGLFDMTGSAMEYVNDWSDYLTGPYLDSSQYYASCAQQGVVKDPQGPRYRGINTHLMRGGSFATYKSGSVAYSRLIYPQDKRIAEYGFRVARGAK